MRTKPDPVTTAILAWAVPGAGHFAHGKWQKGLLYFVCIVGTFIAGWLISDRGDVYFQSGRLHVLLQMGAGAITFVLGVGRKAADPKLTVMRFFEIGTLYTMVAGLLNVLAVMDAVLTALRPGRTRT
jgi:hypothetical protein